MNIPMVRVTLEGMRQEMVHAFASHCQELQDIVHAQLYDILKPDTVAMLVHSELQNHLRRSVADAVSKAIQNVVVDVVRDHVERIARDATTHALRAAYEMKDVDPGRAG